MKCVILAAGEGVRLRPLTNDIPKPMVRVNGKPLLELIINDLPEEVDEVVLVVGYLKDKIMSYFGYKFGRLKIDYVLQDGKHGTYHALELCKHLISDDEKFLMLYADDLHGAENLKNCSQAETCAMLVYEAKDPKRFGVVEVNDKGMIIGIEEKPQNPKTNLVSTGVMLLDRSIFNYPARKHPNGEHYLTDSIAQMIESGHKFQAIRSTFWLPIGYPEDIVRAEEELNNS